MYDNLFRITNSKIIAYHVEFKKITGSATSAIALSQLLYWASKKPRFWKTDEEMIEETGLTIDEWKTAKRKIKSFPFIKVTREGIPAKTWYEVDYKKWVTFLNDKNTTDYIGEIPPTVQRNSHHLYTKTTSKTTSNSLSLQHKVADTLTGWKSKKEWMEYATLLKNAIATVRKVNKTSDTWRWAEAISKIESIDKIPIQRIESVLKWYCKQITQGDLIRDNSSYIPIAYSGASFREKFDRIEAAKKRIAKNDITTEQPQYRYKKTIIQNDDDEGDE